MIISLNILLLNNGETIGTDHTRAVENKNHCLNTTLITIEFQTTEAEQVRIIEY
tara:strand:+ start:1188 stop:1349 length:162 start_codon:yes stop_codon:yes gene_type:complete